MFIAVMHSFVSKTDNLFLFNEKFISFLTIVFEGDHKAEILGRRCSRFFWKGLGLHECSIKDQGFLIWRVLKILLKFFPMC